MSDVNQCGCGWAEVGEDVNPHRKKCPKCGGSFVHAETIRWFESDNGRLARDTYTPDSDPDA